MHVIQVVSLFRVAELGSRSSTRHPYNGVLERFESNVPTQPSEPGGRFPFGATTFNFFWLFRGVPSATPRSGTSSDLKSALVREEVTFAAYILLASRRKAPRDPALHGSVRLSSPFRLRY